MLRRFILVIATVAALGISFSPTGADAHWHGGWGVGAGFLAGALIGGALARPYYYSPGPHYYYDPGPYYYAPGPYYYGYHHHRHCWWRHGHRYCHW